MTESLTHLVTEHRCIKPIERAGRILGYRRQLAHDSQLLAGCVKKDPPMALLQQDHLPCRFGIVDVRVFWLTRLRHDSLHIRASRAGAVPARQEAGFAASVNRLNRAVSAAMSCRIITCVMNWLYRSMLIRY